MSRSAPELKTTLTRDDGIERLSNIAERIGIAKSAIRVRPHPGSRTGMTLTVTLKGGALSKSCDSQPTKDQNFFCLVLWLGDLVRNVERGIETFFEAFYNEGAQGLALHDGAYDGLAVSYYNGNATRDDSFERLESALRRLDLAKSDAKLTWDDARNLAELRLRLRSGRVVMKASSRQETVDKNIHVLALWLQTKAKNYERGLEPDLETLFAANLLPA